MKTGNKTGEKASSSFFRNDFFIRMSAAPFANFLHYSNFIYKMQDPFLWNFAGGADVAMMGSVKRKAPEQTKVCSGLVPLTGIEPVRCCHRGILSPLRLPIPPQRQEENMRRRTAVLRKRFLRIIAQKEVESNSFFVQQTGRHRVRQTGCHRVRQTGRHRVQQAGRHRVQQAGRHRVQRAGRHRIQPAGQLRKRGAIR